MAKPLWMWLIFLGIVITLLILDLGIFHREQREIKAKESIYLSLFYIAVGLLFSLWIWHQLGLQSFAEYLTGFLIEKSLALDNIFLISLVFTTLSIPAKYQHRVLFWGILGVIILRAIMIGLGAQLVSQFSWVLYLFAAFMIFTGIKMFFIPQHAVDINDNKLLNWLRKHVRITNELYGEKFTVLQFDDKVQKNKLFLTPLAIALILIEFIDLIFAVDSVPAIFTITTDPYLVYTSNIFAILGLRALYFALASIINKFYYLKFALAMVLIFIGSKVFIAGAMGWEKFPPLISLGITFTLLFGGCIYSIYYPKEFNNPNN
jgi:tellurite resistance protein TerC